MPLLWKVCSLSLLLLRRHQLLLSLKPPRECQAPFNHRGERCFVPTRGGPVINHSENCESQLKSPSSECKRAQGNFTYRHQEHPWASWGIPVRAVCPEFLFMSNHPLPTEHASRDARPWWEGLIRGGHRSAMLWIYEFWFRTSLSNMVATGYLNVNILKLNKI